MESGNEENNDVRTGPPAVHSAGNSIREDVYGVNSRNRQYDDVAVNSSDAPTTDVSVLKLRKNILRIGDWNVRSMYQAGKVDSLMAEMERLKMDIMGGTLDRLRHERLRQVHLDLFRR